MGKFYRKSQHNYSDDQLSNALAVADAVGVSPAAITKAKKAGKFDTFENSQGKECFVLSLAVDQYRSKRDRRHVTVATIGQKASGFTNEMAQAVAHKPKFDNPGLLENPFEGAGFDFGEAMADVADLETSKAQKEFYLARLAKLKADEMEGKLVPKQVCANHVYQIAANVQDKIMNIYNVLAPEIVGFFEKKADEIGLNDEQKTALKDNAQHHIGELIRRSCLGVLRDIAAKNVNNILD